jgi:hypothetical protein
VKLLKNTTISDIAIMDCGVTIPADSSYLIPPQDYLLFAASSNIVTQVGIGDVVVNDGSYDLSISDGIDFIKGLFPSKVEIVPSTLQTSYLYYEVSSVASGVQTTIATFTAVAKCLLEKALYSTDNVSRFDVYLNSTTIATARNYFTSYSGCFDFISKTGRGLVLEPGDVVEIKAIHNRPYVGSYEATLQLTSL